MSGTAVLIMPDSKPTPSIENKKHAFQLKDGAMANVMKHVKKISKKKMRWFEGKRAHNELVGSGFRRSVNQNELFYVDQDRQITKVLAQDRDRKGYGMRGDGTTDEEGRVPLILTTENLFNQYESHKQKIRELPLFKYSQQKLVFRNNLKLSRTGKTGTDEFTQSQTLNLKYDSFKQVSSQNQEQAARIARFRKFRLQRSMLALGESNESPSRTAKRNKSSKGLKRYDFEPELNEIMAIEREEEFDKFYKRIKPNYIDPIDVMKEIDDFITEKKEKRHQLIGKNLVAGKTTKALEIRQMKHRSPQVEKISRDISLQLLESPEMRKSISSLDRSIDKSYDKFEHQVNNLLRYNEWKQYEPRKMNIQRARDKADLLGYMLIDMKRPYRKKSNFTIDAVEFPMTTKYKKKKFLNSNYEKPPLPPDAIKADKLIKHEDLKMRIQNACTVYDTQHKVKF